MNIYDNEWILNKEANKLVTKFVNKDHYDDFITNFNLLSKWTTAERRQVIMT